MINKKYDVVIVGAGPSGVATALCLAESGLKIAIIDKATFPRDKICGDGLTMDVTNQLAIISKQLYESFLIFNKKIESWSAEIIYSNGMHLNFEQHVKGVKTPIYICKRRDFDNFLFQQLKQYNNINIFEDCVPINIKDTDEGVILDTTKDVFECKIIVGADGINSFVSRKMGVKRVSKEFQYVTLRTYFKNIVPLNEDNSIELYFFKDSLPRYLWIFNMGNNIANVGFGMTATDINKKKINLNNYFDNLLQSEPIKSRLKDAVMIDPIKGYIINIGGAKRDISENRFLLTGDAAALADPLSGEGVGNAIRSGRIAADHIINCFKNNDFSAKYNKAYDKEIYRRMLSEFKFHLIMQKIFSASWLVLYFIKSAANYKIIRDSLKKLSTNLNLDNFMKKVIFFISLIYIFTLKTLFASIFLKKEVNNINKYSSKNK